MAEQPKGTKDIPATYSGKDAPIMPMGATKNAKRYGQDPFKK